MKSINPILLPTKPENMPWWAAQSCGAMWQGLCTWTKCFLFMFYSPIASLPGSCGLLKAASLQCGTFVIYPRVPFLLSTPSIIHTLGDTEKLTTESLTYLNEKGRTLAATVIQNLMIILPNHTYRLTIGELTLTNCVVRPKPNPRMFILLGSWWYLNPARKPSTYPYRVILCSKFGEHALGGFFKRVS